jgi:hypothetical protein
MITIFKNWQNLDLRRIGEYVLCIRDYDVQKGKYDGYIKTDNPKKWDLHDSATWLEGRIYKKGNYYKAIQYSGDPEGALRAGIDDYLPVEFIRTVILLDENNERDEFLVNDKYIKSLIGKEIYNFFYYFEITELSDSISKYNL